MKALKIIRFIIVFLTFFSLLSITACNHGDSGDKTETYEPAIGDVGVLTRNCYAYNALHIPPDLLVIDENDNLPLLSSENLNLFTLNDIVIIEEIYSDPTKIRPGKLKVRLVDEDQGYWIPVECFKIQ